MLRNSVTKGPESPGGIMTPGEAERAGDTARVLGGVRSCECDARSGCGDTDGDKEGEDCASFSTSFWIEVCEACEGGTAWEPTWESE